MPRLPNARLTAALQARAADFFYGDSATVYQDSVSTLDVYGQPSTVSTSGSSIACSFSDKPAVEKWQAYADISEIAAEIRYEGSPAPAKGNRVKLTGRFDGSSYVDQTFEVVGIQDRDVFGYVVALKKVQI